MVGNYKWLLRNEEVEFEKKKFRGKLAGKANKYSQNLDGLVRTRILMFSMVVLVFYRVLSNYLFYGFFSFQFLIERIVLASVILLGAMIFNKARIVGIILSVIPLVLITIPYFLNEGEFDFRTIAFMIAIALMILVGVYNYFQSKRLKK